MTCEVCGCSDNDACVDAETGERCSWAAPELCSFCAAELGVGDDPMPAAPTPAGEVLGTLFDAYGVRIR